MYQNACNVITFIVFATLALIPTRHLYNNILVKFEVGMINTGSRLNAYSVILAFFVALLMAWFFGKKFDISAWITITASVAIYASIFFYWVAYRAIEEDVRLTYQY